MDPLPPRIKSLRLQQQKFCRDTKLAIAHVHVDLFDDGAEDSLSETAPSKSLAPQMGLSDADATTKIVGVGISDVERQMYIPSCQAFTAMNLIQLITKHSIPHGRCCRRSCTYWMHR
jgi:hypothetical protein